MKSGIYIITNTTNNKRYVGSALNLKKRLCQHRGDLRRGAHKNPHLQSAWNKYGEDTFAFDVIERWETEYLISMEQWWMNMLRPEYNIAPVAWSSYGRKATSETRAKMSAANMGHPVSDETRAKIRAGNKGNQNWLGRKHTAETKFKMSQAQKGHPVSDETKKKMSAARKGQKLSDEHRSNISASLMGNRRSEGYRHTAEAKAKISAAFKGKPWPAARRAAQDAKRMVCNVSN